MALQERHFESFNQFATPPLHHAWAQISMTETQGKYLQYQAKLTSALPGQTLQSKDADTWFELCSQRLTDFWQIQCLLMSDIHHSLKLLVQEAQQDLANIRQHLRQLQDKASASARDSAFFNLSIPVENAYGFLTDKASQPYPIESVISLLQQQSQQIAAMESELSETKKALAERKQIERAKGLLMSTLGITEVEAYKTMRSTAMEQKRKIIDVAENILLQHRQV